MDSGVPANGDNGRDDYRYIILSRDRSIVVVLGGAGGGAVVAVVRIFNFVRPELILAGIAEYDSIGNDCACVVHLCRGALF